MNLATIPDLIKKFNLVVGISDHSPGIIVPITSVALGASIIEKHIILSRTEGGPDAAFSLEPKEFKELVKSVRDTERTIGKPSHGAGTKESENVTFRKSLFVVENIKKGQRLTEKNIRSIRPGHGLEPKYYDRIIGKIASVDLEKGTPLKFNHIRNA
jgi:pseudaminic acid synthase